MPSTSPPKVPSVSPAVSHCRRAGIPFTSSFHTRFPDYLRAYARIPERVTYRFLRWFHDAAARTLVPTPSLQAELEAHGFRNIVCWTRGVDTGAVPRLVMETSSRCRGRSSCMQARVAVEKSLEAFLALDLPGSKVVVGDGPARAVLQRRFSQAHWAGFRFGDELARHYAGADVFVFPSRTDTFGIVMLEANACGLPVAAFPVPGPADVVVNGRNGILHHDLRIACLEALAVDRRRCREWAEQPHLAPLRRPAARQPGVDRGLTPAAASLRDHAQVVAATGSSGCSSSGPSQPAPSSSVWSRVRRPIRRRRPRQLTVELTKGTGHSAATSSARRAAMRGASSRLDRIPSSRSAATTQAVITASVAPARINDERPGAAASSRAAGSSGLVSSSPR